MLNVLDEIVSKYAAPVRNIGALAYIKEIETNKTIATVDETGIISIKYERIGDTSKMYGYGICQKVNIHIIDKARKYNFTTANYIEMLFGVNGTYTYFSPKLYISEVRRDEITNELSITAYDKIYQLTKYSVGDLEIETPINIYGYITDGIAAAGLGGYNTIGNFNVLNTTYGGGANFSGEETLREMFDAIAEATQSIYYLNPNDILVFKQLDRDGEAAYTISKEQYYSLDSSSNRRLAAICHTTELGDSITASLAQSGTTQYIRDNPFYELRTDTYTLLENALAIMGGLTINQFECDWRGCPLVEIGDKIALINKDGGTDYTYLLDDVIEYDGTMKQRTQWRLEDDTAETATNPTNLGEVLNQTYARVDKVNKQIDIVAAETTANADDIAALRINTNSIQASVNKTETATNAALDTVNKDIASLAKKVEATITADDVRLEIQKEMTNGTDKVITATGFTFNDEGLRVSKSGTEMETVISEDGMTVYKDANAVLVANNTGVVATNLHANTYLWIGQYSRIEDYEPTRTGVFWVRDGE